LCLEAALPSSHPVRTLCLPARCRLDGIPPPPASVRKAAAVGPGADGDPRGWASAPVRTGLCGGAAHPCRGARRQSGAVGDGGGPPMLGIERGRRRAVGRSCGAGLHRDPAAGGCRRKEWRGCFSDSAWWPRQPVRSADALADRKRAEPGAPIRPESTGRAGVGCRAVSSAGLCTGTMGGQP